ncbi:MAG: hypothetical protein KGI93_11915 [Acidobacteriota bacterium]|nr:hypothetical protein [Acidobacteriota bacterium]MDE3189474.1 hypothetical protein [Acidobacteriota bacterium]
MSLPPDFDELVGPDVDAADRARLQRVHALLVQAGPPPELSPPIEAGPTLAMTMGRRRRSSVRRRVLVLAAALGVLALAFLAGYITGNGGNVTTGTVLQLTGTRAAPRAFASLQLEPADSAGNWPMKLSVKGLPRLGAHMVYEVYLMRGGRPYAPCGTFRVAAGPAATVVQLNAPYYLEHGDSWIVTRQRSSSGTPGVVVLRPVSV